ncbi:MAG: kinase [Clostridium sp.]|nr:kinase [Clostridium sp.]
MVIVRTPFRISFVGGGTDFAEFFREYGGAVLSTTIDRYCYVTVRRLPGFFQYRSEVCYSEIERVVSADDIRHPLIREAMKLMNMEEIRLTYEADLPARSGLGSSSAFAVGMLNAFHLCRGEYVGKRQLADEAIRLEREICGEAGGLQDQIAVAFGGINKILFSSNGYTVHPIVISSERKALLKERLMLFFTGVSRFSFEIQERTRNQIGSRTKILLEMKRLVDEAEGILTNHEVNLKEFGRLLDYGWQLKRKMNYEISTDEVDILYEKAKQAGALGGKLLGAGGGGFLLLYAEPERQEAVRRALDGLLHVPFQFGELGAEVIYHAPEYDKK